MGESGKLVQSLFDAVKAKLADPTTFVILMIDEVESLTSARKNANSALECSDSLRMVNSLLTQLDGIKKFPKRACPRHQQPHWIHRPGFH